MVSQVTLTSAMKSNLLSLQNIQKLMDTTQNRLSTGKKVNSALDNPSSFFTAKSLNSRATALEGLMDTMGQAISTLTATDQAITSMQSFVEQAKSAANTARDTSNVASYMTGAQDMTTIGNPTLIGGVKEGDSFSVRIGEANHIAGTKNITMTQTMGDLGLSAGASLAIKVGDNDYVNIAVATADTVESLAKKINSNSALNGLVTASLVDGKFDLMTADAKQSLTIQSLTAAGAAVRSTSSISVATTLGLDEGKHVTITAPGETTITSSKYSGDGDGTLAASAGASGFPATIRVNVGEAEYDIQFATSTMTISSAMAAVEAQTGLEVTISDGDAMEIADADGRAVKITDISGNVAAKLGIQTADYVKPVTGGMDAFLKSIEAVNSDLTASLKNGKIQISLSTGENFVISDVIAKNGTATAAGETAANLGLQGLADNGENLRADYAKQYDDFLTQIDQMVQNADTGYKGINLLNGDDLLVNFNENRTSFLNIEGGQYDSKNLGLTTARNEWKTNADIDRAISDIDTANARLEKAATYFSQSLSIVQTREDFTQNMVNTLTSGADKLTLADMDEEAANMLALQIRQQLATNSLSMASQSQQAILSLF